MLVKKIQKTNGDTKVIEFKRGRNKVTVDCSKRETSLLRTIVIIFNNDEKVISQTVVKKKN